LFAAVVRGEQRAGVRLIVYDDMNFSRLLNAKRMAKMTSRSTREVLAQRIAACPNQAVKYDLIALMESATSLETILLGSVDYILNHFPCLTDNEITQAMSAIRKMDESCPEDDQECLRWCLGQFVSEHHDILSIREVVDRLEQQARSLKCELEECRTPQKAESHSRLIEEMQRLEAKNAKLKQKLKYARQSLPGTQRDTSPPPAPSKDQGAIALHKEENARLTAKLAKATATIAKLRRRHRCPSHDHELALSEFCRKNEALSAQVAALTREVALLSCASPKPDAPTVSFTAQLESLNRRNHALASELEGKCLKIEQLQAELAAKEADVLRLREARIPLPAGDHSDKQRIGFLLADAMCEHFNPRFCDDEITRLIKVANRQHISLTESLRVSPGCWAVFPPTRAHLFERGM
jgi:hypothetical protein